MDNVRRRAISGRICVDMLRKRRWITIILGVLAIFLITVFAGNTIARYFGWSISKQAPGDLSAALRQHCRVMTPPGSGPVPAGLLFSGCDGPRDNLQRWGKLLNARGWAAIIVDSHTPRGYLDYDMWRLICAGQLLMGSERAGDVLVAINDARQASYVDKDRIVLIGASHGGWAIMELLVFAQDGQLPYGLSQSPPAFSDESMLEGIVGQILLYPYCGIPNRARFNGWRHPAPTLFLLSGNDFIAPAENCLEIAGLLEKRHLPVEVMVFAGVTHGFDQKERASFSTLKFDASATEEATRIISGFLDDVSKAGTTGSQ